MVRRRSWQSLWIAVGLTLSACTSSAPRTALPEIDPSVRRVELAPPAQVEARGRKYMVSTQGRAATQAAVQVLRAGGNLVDAAIAASLAISVERPQSTGLGGGGFLIYHEAKTGKNHVYDFRERAPAKARRDQYLDAKGEVVPGLSLTGGLAVAVPGLLRGLKQVHGHFGRKKWSQLFAPSIRLAEEGFELYPYLKLALQDERQNLARYADSKRIFIDTLGAGTLLKQPELARTLRILARDPEDFYRGKIARKIVATTQATGGNLTLEDLRAYRVKTRAAVEADWKGYRVVSMPPPSSGGIHVVQILKMLERDPLGPADYWQPATLHLMASAMQQAFADRARYLGDPDFVRVPVAELTSDAYLARARARFDLARARTQAEVTPGALSDARRESFETTHLSLMDSEGNAIVTTQTINGWFGSKVVAEGTGILLNNEMDDFSAKPGAANLFGAVGGTENEIAPGKTPLSSMSPTLVFKDGKPVLAVGAPGGTRIITAVAQTILNHLVFGRSLYEAVGAPRIHQQWTPDLLSVENQAVPVEKLEALSALGWKLKRIPQQSAVMAVSRDADGTLTGVADPRDIGTSSGE